MAEKKSKLSRRSVLQGMGLSAGAVGMNLPGIRIGASQHEQTNQDNNDIPVTGATDPTGAGEVASVADGEFLTTNQGVRVSDDQNTLRAGERGPSLLEDFHFREKMTHFDHERIPERVVHARGSAAHGFFQVYESLAQYTKAQLFQDPAVQTPVFVRFSVVNSFRGTADTVRDARGFATKFYTQEGVWDLVGNQIPVFFIQDAIKFPDLVHAFNPEPHNHIPTGSTAHDNFWDFISLTPESMHMVMWVMSDRAIPRSYRMMDGFGIHTFRLVNAQGKSTFVKFHWLSTLGAHSLVWDEAQKISGKDPEFHRRDLWDAIEMGDFPEYELGMQLIDEATAGQFNFDLIDPTKLVPEDLVPVQRVGKLTLNKNPDNFFMETEQVAFHPGHIVPGIDFSDDPLLQGRLFSYLDTQINRFGAPNFHQLPINQPKSPVNNYQQDSFMRYANRPGKVNYEPNSLGGNAREAKPEEGGFVSYSAPTEGTKVRARSQSFGDHFTQATMFYNSLSDPEKLHINQALQFELGKVMAPEVRQRMVDLLANVDANLAKNVGNYLGLTPKAGQVNANAGTTKGLSQLEEIPGTPLGRKVAILAAAGVNGDELTQMQSALQDAGVTVEVVAPHLGTIQNVAGAAVPVNQSLLTTASVLYDAVYVPGGADSVSALQGSGDALHFIQEAFKHYKPIAASAEGADFCQAAGVAAGPGVVTGEDAGIAGDFLQAIGQHRFWDRQLPA